MCFVFFVLVLFYGGSFFYAFVKPINFFVIKNLVIIYKLSNNREFLLQRERLCHNLGFCHNLGKIAKEFFN
jgi:hypothetical protein